MKAQKLKSGSYRVRVMIDGKSYSFTDKDKKTALKRARNFKEQTEEALSNPTLKEAMEKYVTENESVLSASTIRAYRSIMNRLIKEYPWFSAKTIISIRSEDVQKIVYTLKRSPKTLKNYVGFISVVTGKSYKIKMPQKEPGNMSIPTDLEVAGLIKLFERSELEIPILLAAYGPLRRGEICALTPNDFDGDYVTVSKDVVRDYKNNWVIKPPKTFSSNRTIKLPPFVAEKIRLRKGKVTEYNPEQISQKFRRVQKNLDIEPYYKFHALRHYCVSTLHAKGIPDEYIMERGGWATPHVLQNVYRHTLSDQSEKMSEKALSHFRDVSNFESN